MVDGELSEDEVQDDEIAADGVALKEVEEVEEGDMPEVLDGQSFMQNNKRAKLRVVHRSSVFVGPLPSPETFKQYEEICPGAAGRLISMAEKQMDHRLDMEKQFLNSRSRNSIVGIIAASVISIVIIIVGGLCIMNDHPVSGTLFGGAGITTIIATFIKNTKMTEDKHERNTQDKENTIEKKETRDEENEND